MVLSVGPDTAITALRAHQLAVDVASHNIANANTPGFSRQRVQLTPIAFQGSAFFGRDSLLGRAGQGVDASDVRRIRDPLLDYQARQFFSQQTQFENLAGVLQQAELFFNEPADEGINKLFADFWSALQDVTNDPESAPARTTLVHAATTLGLRFNRLHNDLTTLREDTNLQVGLVAEDLNRISHEISDLNLQIKEVELNGEMANDLRDRRDVLLDELSSIAQVSYSEQGDSTVVVYLGNHELVSAGVARDVYVRPMAGNPGMDELAFTIDDLALSTSTGKLAGIFEARDVAIPDLLTQLDDLANGLITEINAVHTAGFGLDGSTGNDFFTGVGASGIAFNAVLAANPDAIAASTSGAPGDGSNALAIADLQLANLMAAGSRTFDQFYADTISVLGADTARAHNLAESNGLLVENVEALRQSVSGVNLDEEVSNLTLAQHAYDAAARVITTIDQMLEKLINETGIVGR